MNLLDTLKNLNAAECEWGVWVNPSNPDKECSINQVGRPPVRGWVNIGSLDQLSFGNQSIHQFFGDAADAAGAFLDGISEEELLDSFLSEELDPEVQAEIQTNLDFLMDCAAQYEAQLFIDEALPSLINNQ